MRTDRIDFYFAHNDDEETPLEDAIGAFDALVAEGKILHYGLSNYSPTDCAKALALSPRISALQPLYSLAERGAATGRRETAREGIEAQGEVSMVAAA